MYKYVSENWNKLMYEKVYGMGYAPASEKVVRELGFWSALVATITLFIKEK